MLNKLHKNGGKKDGQNEVNSQVRKFIVSHCAEMMGAGSKTTFLSRNKFIWLV